MLDTYDATGTRQLGTRSRADVHRDGDWHRAFHLWVASAGGVLFQRRAAGKDTFPGMLDASAAGHLTAGEQIADGLREVQEELGVAYALDQLVDLGVHRVEDRPTPQMTNREFQHVFAVRDERPLQAWTDFDRGELAGVVLVSHPGYAGLVIARAAVEAHEWDGETVRAVVLQPDEVVPAPYLAAISPALRDVGVM
jgi:hypothetical protein